MKIAIEMEKEDFVSIIESLQGKVELNVSVKEFDRIMAEKMEKESKLKTPLYKILTSRPCNVLEKHNIRTLEDLVQVKTPKIFLEYPGMGKACYKEICKKVDNLGLTFNMTLAS